ncbi:hypothetical protein ZIOFF_033916 [Zingiber officinale]|uniref:Biogenesis of lysosome-related organelles complex 1 subunit 1 n=1 Tax=Zingiber officinale TaxID=94328 RepID=A0A8J5GKE0_ZINOF|nr:hypothetical protein ZIOFF_033916 [Zingiber officinale]
MSLTSEVSGTSEKGANILASEKMAPSGQLVFAVGIGALLFVPVFKAITGLPPYIGDVTSMYIDFGICLESAEVLRNLANYLDTHIPNVELIAIEGHQADQTLIVKAQKGSRSNGGCEGGGGKFGIVASTDRPGTSTKVNLHQRENSSVMLFPLADKAKKDALQTAIRVSELLVETVNGQVEATFINEKRIELEIRALVSTIMRYKKQTDQWLAASHALNTVIKEIGDFENWMKIMDFDCKTVNAAIRNIHQI